jgi:hypothetical protein
VWIIKGEKGFNLLLAAVSQFFGWYCGGVCDGEATNYQLADCNSFDSLAAPFPPPPSLSLSIYLSLSLSTYQSSVKNLIITYNSNGILWTSTTHPMLRPFLSKLSILNCYHTVFIITIDQLNLFWGFTSDVIIQHYQVWVFGSLVAYCVTSSQPSACCEPKIQKGYNI